MNTDLCRNLLLAFVLIIWVACLPLSSAAQDNTGPPAKADTTVPAEADTPPIAGTVLIRNVTLIDQSGEKKEAIVNILIRDKILDVITRDEIPLDSAELAFDAKKGFLMGKLKLGGSPSFLILNRDPREDFDTLLDTKKHARFAVRKGEIVFNRLQWATEIKATPKRSGWLAYTPPPIALSTSFTDTTKWNRWDTKYISGLFIGALAMDRQNWLSQNNASETSPIGNLNDFSNGEIRGLRFGVFGTLNFPQPWVYTIAAATNAFNKGFDVDSDKNIAFFDWRLDIPAFEGTTLSIGKQKEPISDAGA
jgi:phosphate-selective porin OprO/OprP